jgi:isoleucyl-tRNA synthetase
MKADLVKREPARLAQWEATRLYERIQAARAGAPTFILHDGPPFANGEIHLGHVLNKILKDLVLKFKTLRGCRAPYVPGWDCHGLPIEFKVTQELRKAGQESAQRPPPPAATPPGGLPVTPTAPAARDAEFSPAAIRNACDAYARKHVAIQRDQFKRLGILGEWDNPYLTLAKEYEAEELRLFARLVERGFVYRGKKPVYWSIPCRTALAEAEVEYQDHVSQSIYVKFPVRGHENTFLLLWTTTPWTLPANLAVAFNSTFSYSLVRVPTGDGTSEDYLVSALLLSTVAAKCGWTHYQIVRSLDDGHLRQISYQHPFCARTGQLYAGDEFVTNDAGTGFVHVAPGHGLEDYALGLRQNLPIYSPVDDDGRFAWTDDLPREQQMPADLLGKSILERHGKSDANEAVLHELRARQALVHQENYHHSYPHCWRSKTPVIFRAMDQWFIRVDHRTETPATGATPPASTAELRTSNFQLPTSNFEPRTSNFGLRLSDFDLRQLALAAIEHVRWIPEWGINRIQGAVQSRPDWCISRQRSWGVPLPAFYTATGEPILDARVVRNVARLVEQHGSNVWFEKTAADLWALVRPADWTGPEATGKSADTLDVWIDSGSSSQAVTARRAELQRQPATSPAAPSPLPPSFQADLYLEGSDQHRGWFQSSLLLSLAGNDAPPYQTVLTHGFVVGDTGEKEAKSRGSKSATLWVNDFGADVLRLWVASQDYRGDMVLSEARMLQVAETYRLLRNTLRYQLANLYDFDPTQHAVADGELTSLDRWILHAFAQLENEVLRAYEAYEFHQVYQRLGQFAAVELSAIYHDVIKDRLYTDPANSPRRRSTQTTLYRIGTSLCQLLAPMLAFTADEAWEFLPGRPKSSVHETVWQPLGLAADPADVALWTQLFKLRDQALVTLEQARRDKVIGKALEAQLQFAGPAALLEPIEAHADLLRELLNVSALTFARTDGDQIRIQLAAAEGRKCERCWHWETTVGAHAAHPTLCHRCLTAVGSHLNI